MFANSLKRYSLKFINPINIVFIILLIIFIVMFDITKFSTTRTKVFGRNFKQLIIPNKTSMTENEMFMASEKETNLPLIYWSKWKKLDKNQNKLNGNMTVCDDIELPSPHLLKFNNIHWQQMSVNNNLTLYLFNAYYDNREEIKKVKVISVTNTQKATEVLDLW